MRQIDKLSHYPARHRSRLGDGSRASASWLFIALLMAPIQINGQEPKKWSRDQLISTAREIMTTTRYCALITTDARGVTHARTMDAFAPDEQMTIWLATNPRSRKAAEIRRHPRVTLYYFDPENQAYVTINGIARLVNDAREKSRHWKDEWKAFYPNRDRDYLLIEVTPARLEVVNTKTGVVGDARTWQAPAVTFPRRRQD